MYTFSLPKAELLTFLLMEEAVAVASTATVDEGSACSSLTAEVPAQSVSLATPLFHGEQARVCRRTRSGHVINVQTEEAGQS